MLTVARRAIPCGSVEITRRVVARFGLSVTQLGRDVSLPRRQIAVTPFDVALARSCGGISICPRGLAVLIYATHAVVRPGVMTVRHPRTPTSAQTAPLAEASNNRPPTAPIGSDSTVPAPENGGSRPAKPATTETAVTLGAVGLIMVLVAV